MGSQVNKGRKFRKRLSFKRVPPKPTRPPTPTPAPTPGRSNPTPRKDQRERRITVLSDEDVSELRKTFSDEPVTVLRIIQACGGAPAIIEALSLRKQGVYDWQESGIPLKHFSTLFELSGGAVKPEHLLEVNQQLRDSWKT